MNIINALNDKYVSRCIVEKIIQQTTQYNVRLYNQEREQLPDPFTLELGSLTKEQFYHALRSTALYEKTGDFGFVQMSPLGGLHARITQEPATEFRHLQAAYATFTHGAAQNSLFFNRSGTALTAIGPALKNSEFHDESGFEARLEARVVPRSPKALQGVEFNVDKYTPTLDLQPAKLY